MVKPFFTIIVLDSGDTTLLQKSVLLVKEQINTSWELIVSMPAGFDPAMLDTLGFDNTLLRKMQFVSNGQSTIPARLNACITLARGEYIVFLRSCDCWNGIHLEALFQHAQLYTDCACCIVRAVVYQKNILHDTSCIQNVEHHPTGCAVVYTARDIAQASFPKLSQVAVRRKVLVEQQGFDESFQTFFLEKLFLDICSPTGIHIINAFSVYIYERAERQWYNTSQVEKETIDALCASKYGLCAVPAARAEKVQTLQCAVTDLEARCKKMSTIAGTCSSMQSSDCTHNAVAKPAKHCLQLYYRAKQSCYFDAQWYAKYYGLRFISPFLHYCIWGWKRGYDPSPAFNTAQYLNRYPDVKRAKVNPLLHYIQSGIYEGRAL